MAPIFMGGSNSLNPTKSSFCPAFAEPVVPKLGNTTSDKLLSGEKPEKKKLKTVHGQKYTPSASLRIAWRDMEVKVMDGSTPLHFAYSRPCLVNTDDFALLICGRPLHREREDFYDQEFEKNTKEGQGP